MEQEIWIHCTGQLVWVPDARVEARVEEQVAPRSCTINM